MATGAAFLALLGGVQVAQAGIADGVGDPVGAVENALPNPPETDLDAVVEEATDAVDELTGSVDADAAVSDAKGAVDAAVADPTGTAAECGGAGEEQGREPDGNRQGHRREDARRQGRQQRHKERRSGRFRASPRPHGTGRRSRRFRGAIRSSAPVEALCPGSHHRRSREPAGFSASGTGSHSQARPAGLDRVVCFGADRPDRRAVGSGRLDGRWRRFLRRRSPQGFLRGSGRTVRSASCPAISPRRPPPSPAQPEPHSSLRSSARSSSWPRGQADWLGLDRTSYGPNPAFLSQNAPARPAAALDTASRRGPRR